MSSETLDQTAVSGWVDAGEASLGIEFGSTNIKAVLVGPGQEPLASGSHQWENQFVDQLWTYPIDEVWIGLQNAFASLKAQFQERYGRPLNKLGAIGISAMMHGYLAFGAEDELLVPFRTWRNTNTEVAASELTQELGFNFPLRWSASHLYQAVVDEEAHVPNIEFFTTLAGYVHWKLTGRKVLGVGDASGMFPIDPTTRNYDAEMLAKFNDLVAARQPGLSAAKLLPEVLVAGQDAGELTAEGALLLDPSGELQAGIPLCPPEGDAGTGMVATASVAPRTGNVSAGTSIFAMVVLEKKLEAVHPELDIVTTPAGDLVAMVHCNNGASELGVWAALFGELAAGIGAPVESDAIFEALLKAALQGEADGGGLLAYNYLAGEPIVGLAEGRPMVVRGPNSRLNLANFARVQLYSIFGALSLGLKVLADEGVAIDSMFAHGGLFRTAGVAQQLLAAALNVPVGVGATASEGGAWGIAVLADYRRRGADLSLDDYLTNVVFSDAAIETAQPQQGDVEGFQAFLEHYEAGIAIEQAATAAIS